MTRYPISDDKRILFEMPAFIAGLDWQLGVPTHSERVIAFSVGQNGMPYQLPFKCVYKHGVWYNAVSRERLDVTIEGWR